MFQGKTIRLFWWNEMKLQGKTKENYGDLLGKYLVEKIADKKVVWTKPSEFSFQNIFRPIYVTIGSILTNVNEKCIVWGSGIISKEYKIKKAKFLAVRGPQTRMHLVNQGYDVPEVYGDPALLLPRYYKPEIKKEYKMGVVPHYNDFKKVSEWYENDDSILLIDLMTNSIEETTNQFLKCEKIVSSSLHGVIISHAYGIPAVWQKFSDDVFGDDIKYRDYFESVKMESYQSEITNDKMNLEALENVFNRRDALPDQFVIKELCDGLMAACPFKSQS